MASRRGEGEANEAAWVRRCRVVARLALPLCALFVAIMSLKPFGTSEFERAIDRVGRGYFHIPAYAGLAALAVLALPAHWKAPRRAWVGAIAATVCGWGLELAQRLTPDRTFNVQGLVFDAAGAAIGAVVAWALLAGSARGAATRRPRRGGTENHHAPS